MDKHAIFDAWAPATAVWSPWVKPAPFAHLPRPLPDLTGAFRPQFDLGWLTAAHVRCAIVADLPGTTAVYFALQLAGLGWQPVSLLNACPAPAPLGLPLLASSAVDMEALLAVLVATAPELAAKPPPPGAPPVFVLDADRQGLRRTIEPGMFDNRSVVFASDFPSAGMLAKHGITEVLVVRDASDPVGRDLVHALAPWLKAGIEIGFVTTAGLPIAESWSSTGFLAETWFRFTTWFMRRNPQGGFGAFVPESSGG